MDPKDLNGRRKPHQMTSDGSGNDRGRKGNTEEGDERGIEVGARSERWHDRVEELAEDNRTRTINNSKYLARLDYRTAWIMRVLVGLMATVGAALILQIISF